MEYRVLPHSGLKVSTIGIGSGSVHESNEKQIVELIDYAQEQGINLIDMATSYPEPWAHYGVALKGRRDRFHLQMHLGITYETGEYSRKYGLESIKRSFAHQMEITGSDYADLAVFHCVDTPEDYDKLISGGAFDYAVKLKRDGVIRNLGVATHTVEMANRFIAGGEIDAFMFSINAAYDFDPAVNDPYGEDSKTRSGIIVSRNRQKLLQDCVRMGIGINVMKAYGGGKLLDARNSPFGRAMSIPQCLKYALDRPAVVSCMVGVRSKQDLEEALRLYSAAEEDLDYSFIAEIQPKEMRGACVYCNHCMPCPVGIDIGQTHKFFDLYMAGDEMAGEHYYAMNKNAKDCIQCGVCESRCPFGVAVREKMQAAAAAL
ncbi:MAG: aldo/keto reductase [Clostridiales bacterium]